MKMHGNWEDYIIHPANNNRFSTHEQTGMKTMKKNSTVIVFIVLASFAHPVFAYLDPGAGSFMLQMLIAGVMGAMFTIKLYWYKLKSFIASLFGKTVENPMEEKPDSDENLKDNSTDGSQK